MKFDHQQHLAPLSVGILLSASVLIQGCQLIRGTFSKAPVVDEAPTAVKNRNDSPQTYTNQRNAVTITKPMTAEEKATLYFDNQFVALKKQIRISEVNHTQDKLIHIRCDADSYFIGATEIPSDFAKMNLKSLASILNEYPLTSVIIENYNDNTGSDRFNDGLTYRRSAQIANLLVLNGVNPDRLKAAWFGKRSPIGDNTTMEGRRLNRRAEIFIVPSQALLEKIKNEVAGTY